MQWYFDFVSPYAYLQSTRLESLTAHGELQCVPVLFAGLLEHWGNIGPAELAPKRRATFRQIAWRAHRDGIKLTLPPRHPFNPLPLLRASQALGNPLPVVQRLFRFVWAEGRLPDDGPAFAGLLEELGLEPAALADESVKRALRENGERAIEAGVFGVPTIAIDGEPFWGDDATEMALAYLRARDGAGAQAEGPAWPYNAISAADALPQGTPSPGIGAPRQAASRPGPTPGGPRIPLLPPDLSEPAALVSEVRRRRGGELLELDRLLLYSPPLAEGWNHMLGNVRTRLAVDMKLRELAMCVVARLNGADYEFHHHAPLWLEAGATEAQVAAIQDPVKAMNEPGLFDELERAAVRLTVEMTRDIRVSGEAFDTCRRHLGEARLVELVAVIAAYNMVSRFLVAFELHPPG